MKKQISAAHKRRTHFDRKVQESGYSRLISVTKVVPKGWEYVRLTVKTKHKNYVVLLIEKLVGVDINASIKKNSKRSKQDASRTGATSRN